MPDPNDPRYRGTGPPSLEQLRALLRCSTVESFRSPDGKYSEIRFKVDNEKLHESGASYYGTDQQIYAGFLEILDRITEFEDITRRHSDNITGVTCDDMIALFNHELKAIHPGSGLLETMRMRMFENAIRKIEELKEWRRAADAKRREKERAQREQMKKERERREKEDEILREQMRREKMWQERRRASEEKAKKTDPGSGSQEDEFEKGFWSAFGMGQEEWTRRYQQQWRDAFSQSHNRQRESHYEQSQQRPKARNKNRAPWFEVLGVEPNVDKDAIKKAWRSKIGALHPDRITDPVEKAAATEKMKDLNTAKDEGLRGLG